MAQTVKIPPAMRETWVRSLGWEEPLEEGMTTHSSVLAWRTPWTGMPGGLRSLCWRTILHLGHNKLLLPCFKCILPSGTLKPLYRLFHSPGHHFYLIKMCMVLLMILCLDFIMNTLQIVSHLSSQPYFVSTITTSFNR